MKPVAKYNLFKGISTALTVGTPMISLMSCSDLFVHRSDTAISMAGVLAILLSVLFFKDKIMENLKVPSPFIISVIGLVLILLVESIMHPMKVILTATAVVTGADTLVFKRLYKNIELDFPDDIEKYKHFGFVITKSEILEEKKKNGNSK